MDMNIQIELSPQILKLIADLDEFKGRWSVTRSLAPERLSFLRKIATIESVGSSTRIEGVKLTNQEVEALLSSVKANSFRSRDEQEVAGYADLMDLIFSSFEEIPFSENHIKQLHKNLLKYSAKDERHRGEYKKFPNHIEAFDKKGKSLGIVFETTLPFDTPSEMKSLIVWTRVELEKKELHALLVISIFVMVFLKIHPFQDGNGRLSRALTGLLLLQQGYTYVPYSSLERIIEENKDNYYLSLRRAQTTFKKKKSFLNEWIVFFLQSMKKQKDILELKLGTEELLASLPELSLQIIELIQQHGPLSVAEIEAKTHANRNTIKLHFKKLVNSGRLKREGAGRGVRYRIK